MKFRFEFDIQPLPQPINHYHKLFLIGSCFTENIGEKLKKHKFSVVENPNGILFNPVSVAETIINIIENKQYTKADLFNYNEAWHSWQHHSRFSGITVEDTLQKINSSTTHAHNFLKQADVILITLGSAWVYTLTEKALNATKGSVAANNHKAPADWFERKLPDTAQIITILGTMLDRLGAFNPNIQVIFTISPVRHLREGVIDNNRSKAALITAIHYLIEQLPKLYYFPAYELVLDDLRDYRFYAEDLVHPNYHATQYVWERFMQSCMNKETVQLIDNIIDINLAYQHKAFNPSSEQHKKFLHTYWQKTKLLKEQYPNLDFEKELAHFAQ
ncbi:MAG: GSCFA domain-containing protein [Chitinophagaceae bacterium]|nr:GSCFA domain-containing protein [Chitinophagaceae bacterium]MCW5904466.1 GSCFA domain-containing protein [Chitinophagaceae bacterium]